MRMFLVVDASAVAVTNTTAAATAETKTQLQLVVSDNPLTIANDRHENGAQPFVQPRLDDGTYSRQHLKHKSSVHGVGGVVPSAGASGEADTPGSSVTLFHATKTRKPRVLASSA